MKKEFHFLLTVTPRLQAAAALSLSFLVLPCAVWAQEPPKPALVEKKDRKEKLIETEIVTLTPEGAIPDAIVRKAEPFFLLLLTQPKETLPDVNLVPVAALPDPLKPQGIINQHSFHKKKRSTGLVDLPPGEYHLQTSDNQILCTITLQ